MRVRIEKIERWMRFNVWALIGSFVLPWSATVPGFAMVLIGIASLVWDCCSEWALSSAAIIGTLAAAGYAASGLNRLGRLSHASASPVWQRRSRVFRLVALLIMIVSFSIVANWAIREEAKGFPFLGFWLLCLALTSSTIFEVSSPWLSQDSSRPVT